MNAVADKLDEARALIEQGWTKGWFARNTKGRPVTAKPTGKAAVCFCASGALIRATGIDEYRITITPEYRTLDLAVSAMGGDCIEEWNDAPERTQAEVIEAFKKAAALARAEA